MLRKLFNYFKNYDDITSLQNDYESLERCYNKVKEENEYFKGKIRFDDSASKNNEDCYYELIERLENEIIRVNQYSDKNITLKLKRILDEVNMNIKNSYKVV